MFDLTYYTERVSYSSVPCISIYVPSFVENPSQTALERSFYLDSLHLFLDSTLHRYHRQSLKVHLSHIHYHTWPCNDFHSAPVNYRYKVKIFVHCLDAASPLCYKKFLKIIYIKKKRWLIVFTPYEILELKKRLIFLIAEKKGKKRSGGAIERVARSRLNSRVQHCILIVASFPPPPPPPSPISPAIYGPSPETAGHKSTGKNKDL